MLKKLSFLFIFLFSLGYAQDCIPGGDDNTLCLSYGVSDPDAGILDINYSSESEITSLNMFVSPELDILSIESDFSFSELIELKFRCLRFQKAIISGTFQDTGTSYLAAVTWPPAVPSVVRPSARRSTGSEP